jgi:hypothetical protein
MGAAQQEALVLSGRTLRLPSGVSADLLSDEASAQTIDTFVRESPDHTVYHRPPYIEFARRQNGAADLLMFSAHGAPLVAFPFHPVAHRISTGYAGVCFSSGGRAAVRRGLITLAEFVHLNRDLRFQSLQSAQAPAVDDRVRAGFLALVVDSIGAQQKRLHTRLIRLPTTGESNLVQPIVLTLDPSHEPIMRGYDPDLRNQIRQASRRGVTGQVVIPGNTSEAQTAYAEFQPIHEASWRRTGMVPHGLNYQLGLEASIRDGGGKDVMVFARTDTGRAVAAVTCHVYGDRAIYWSGCSLPEAQQLRANPFCLHVAIRAMQQLGVRTFELGRFNATETDDKEISVNRYKAQFGGEVQRVLNFDLGAPRVDAQAIARGLRNRARHWWRHRSAMPRGFGR